MHGSSFLYSSCDFATIFNSLIREMVHLAIDGIWQVFKLQQSILRKDFCRIAAKSGIFNRLVITLHSLNEATRLAAVSGSGVLALAQNDPKPLPRPRSGQLEIQTQTSHSGQLDAQRSLRPGSADLDGSPKFSEAVAGAIARRSSIDRSPRHSELVSNGGSGLLLPQNEQVRPLLSLLEKELPSRHVSGQLDYVRHLSGLERHESILPLLHASTTERKPNGELESLMAEFAGRFSFSFFFIFYAVLLMFYAYSIRYRCNIAVLICNCTW
jgi:hypothetical protein